MYVSIQCGVPITVATQWRNAWRSRCDGGHTSEEFLRGVLMSFVAYSAFRFASRTTLPQISESRRMRAANSSGELVIE
jgi:hypothetical protein